MLVCELLIELWNLVKSMIELIFMCKSTNKKEMKHNNLNLQPKKINDLCFTKITTKRYFVDQPTVTIGTEPSIQSLKSIYYGCSLSDELSENKFLAISVNKRSHFIDPLMAQKIVNHLMIPHKKNENKIMIFICDYISHFNFQAFDKMNQNKATQKSIQLGNIFVSIFQDVIKNLGLQKRIEISRWNDNKNILEIERLVIIMSSNPQLNQRVETIANYFISHRGQGKVNSSYKQKLELVKQYIYYEIPIFISGIHCDGIHYRMLYYSGTEEHLSNFAENQNCLHSLVIDIVTKDEFKDIFDQIILNSVNKIPKIIGFVGIVVDENTKKA